MIYEITGTRQEVFDKVVTHLVKQGKKAMTGMSCMYRTADGLKCAVGCLIPDDAYVPEFEGFTFVNLVMCKMLKVADGLYSFIGNLQTLHDLKPQHHVFTVDDFTAIANEYDLTLPEIS